MAVAAVAAEASVLTSGVGGHKGASRPHSTTGEHRLLGDTPGLRSETLATSHDYPLLSNAGSEVAHRRTMDHRPSRPSSCRPTSKCFNGIRRMQIDISGHQIVFPISCACCNSHADSVISVSSSKSTGKKVVRINTNVWEFPYCTPCLLHAKAYQDAEAVLAPLAVISLIVGIALWWRVGPYLGIPAAILALFASGWVHSSLMTTAKNSCKQSCACPQVAVAYLDWHGSLHKFEIASQRYALTFMVANYKKLVNLSSTSIALLTANGHTPPPGTPRIVNRHRR